MKNLLLTWQMSKKHFAYLRWWVNCTREKPRTKRMHKRYEYVKGYSRRIYCFESFWWRLFSIGFVDKAVVALCIGCIWWQRIGWQSLCFSSVLSHCSFVWFSAWTGERFIAFTGTLASDKSTVLGDFEVIFTKEKNRYKREMRHFTFRPLDLQHCLETSINRCRFKQQ